MLKTRKRWVSLLVAVVMVAALLVPFVGTASAATTYSLSYVPSVSSGGAAQAFTSLDLTVTMDNSSVLAMQSGGIAGQVILELPSSPTGYLMTLGAPADPTGLFSGATGFGATYNNAGPPATSSQISIQVGAFTANQANGNNTTTSSFSIPITSLTIPGGVNGAVTLTAAAPNGSMFASGSLTLATAGTGSVTLAAESVQSVSSGSNQAIGYIDITESMAAAISNSGGTALKLTLPSGVTWDSVQPLQKVWGAWGSAGPWLVTDTANAGRELDISVPSAVYESSTAVFAKLIGTVDIDESVAKQGDVVVTVSGSATYSPSTLTVANYGTFAVTDKVLSTPTITAGMAGSTIGEFEILESLPGSLLPGRNIDLTLPTNVAWSEVPTVDESNSTLDNFTNPQIYSVGSTGNEIEIEIEGAVSNPTESPAVIALKNAEVTPAVDFTGPLTVTVSGDEGLSGTINLGTVAAGVTAAASAEPDIIIGTASAAVGNLTITEAAAGNIQSLNEYSGLDESTAGDGDGAYINSSGATSSGAAPGRYFVATTSGSGTAEIDVWAPSGVTFFNTPTVTVTAGDLQVGTVSTNTVNGQGELVIQTKSTSTAASTISVTGAEVTVDRTVPEGPITFKVKGTGVDETELGSGAPSDIAPLFPNDTTAASANVANVSTSAGNGQVTSGVVVFSIGQASYTVNGTSVSTDVAPYIKDSRTFVPLRAVANALGVPDSGIIWDPTSDKVTIIKGSLVAQFTIGSDIMLLNGATITMDTSPEITDGRTCLPIAWAAQALGVTYTWDGTAQTVTFGTPATAPAAGLPSAPSGGAATTNPTTSTTTNPTTTP